MILANVLYRKQGFPRFGCRQIAFMTEGKAPSAAQQTMLLDMLRDNPQSLKAQSKKGRLPQRNGITAPLHEEDLIQAPLKGNTDGWGMAAYGGPNGDQLQLQRSLKPAAEDSRFDTVAEQMSRLAPRTMLAHILNKVDPNRILASEEDVHPFYQGAWSGMFNGVLDGGRTPQMTNAVNNIYCPVLGCQPKGTNTGEKILLTFLGKLKQRFSTVDSTNLARADLECSFADTLQDFLKLSKPVYRPLDGSVSGLKGQIQLGPGCNYVVTDGNVLMAFRKGRKLYLNRHKALRGNMGYLIASEPVQPKRRPLTWVELPQDHILTLARKASGKIEATLTPLTAALSQPTQDDHGK